MPYPHWREILQDARGGVNHPVKRLLESALIFDQPHEPKGIREIMRLSYTRVASRLALYAFMGAALITATTSARAVSPVEPPKGLTAPPQGTRMPAFELPGIDSTKARSADLRDKVTVIRFWATW